jgi:hypothetical protein
MGDLKKQDQIFSDNWNCLSETYSKLKIIQIDLSQYTVVKKYFLTQIL